MRAQRVVLDQPLADHDAGLEHVVELFAVEHLVAHRAVEAFHERVLLWTAFLDERGLDALLGQPGAQAYLPYSDDAIYFDTSGCCDLSLQRISANINT